MNRANGPFFASAICLAVLVSCAPASQLFPPVRTATPNFSSRTPEPTRTPLKRATRITDADYGQTLQIFIGDTFVLEKPPSLSNLQIAIGDTRVLKLISIGSEINSEQAEFEAIAPGESTLSAYVNIPCPHAPVGCQPPMDYIFVTVKVNSP